MIRPPRAAAGSAWLAAATVAVLLCAQAWNRALASQSAGVVARSWPAITRETKPWTRWWWQGSAVEPDSITAQLEALKAAGIGGVEITPIYGVRGAEERFIPYLSEAWMKMLEHTLREARRLELGVDMATGTGWPFGGPWVDDDISPRSIAHRTWMLGAGERLTEPVRLRQAPLVRALGNQIHVVNEGAPGDPPRAGTHNRSSARMHARSRSRISPTRYRPTSNLQALALEQVKYPRDLPLTALMAYADCGRRAGPDGQGRSGRHARLDGPHWPVDALRAFLGLARQARRTRGPGRRRQRDRSFLGRRHPRLSRCRSIARSPGRSLAGLRAFFNDSYEVDDATGQADWTPRSSTSSRTGAATTCAAPARALRAGQDDLSARVLADYRETISDLLLDTFTTEWSDVGEATGASSAQPGARLAGRASSISTRRATSPRPRAARSSASSGRRPPRTSPDGRSWRPKPRPGSANISASTLADVRAAVDRFFVAGVNHIVYHGTAYSPQRDAWPGWQFYAGVEFNPAERVVGRLRRAERIRRARPVVPAGRAGPNTTCCCTTRSTNRWRSAETRCSRTLAAPNPAARGTTFEEGGRPARGRRASPTTSSPIGRFADASSGWPAHHRRRQRPTARSCCPRHATSPLETFVHMLSSGATRRDGRVVQELAV